jgi:hypothetical protein
MNEIERLVYILDTYIEKNSDNDAMYRQGGFVDVVTAKIREELQKVWDGESAI